MRNLERRVAGLERTTGAGSELVLFSWLTRGDGLMCAEHGDVIYRQLSTVTDLDGQKPCSDHAR